MSRGYEVGYRKPPRHTRFKKGRSGNPSGRPKGTKNISTDLLEELSERIRIREGDRKITVSKQRALLKTLTAKALKGDTRAAALVLNLVWRVVERGATPDPITDLTPEDQAILDDWIKAQAAPKRGTRND